MATRRSISRTRWRSSPSSSWEGRRLRRPSPSAGWTGAPTSPARASRPAPEPPQVTETPRRHGAHGERTYALRVLRDSVVRSSCLSVMAWCPKGPSLAREGQLAADALLALLLEGGEGTAAAGHLDREAPVAPRRGVGGEAAAVELEEPPGPGESQGPRRRPAILPPRGPEQLRRSRRRLERRELEHDPDRVVRRSDLHLQAAPGLHGGGDPPGDPLERPRETSAVGLHPALGGGVGPHAADLA